MQYLERKVKQLGNETKFCDASGISNKRLKEIKALDCVDIYTVDKIAARLGDHISEIWVDFYMS